MAPLTDDMGQLLLAFPDNADESPLAVARPHEDPVYVESFVKECFDRGMPEEEAAALLRVHLVDTAARTDPAFARGFQAAAVGS